MDGDATMSRRCCRRGGGLLALLAIGTAIHAQQSPRAAAVKPAPARDNAQSAALQQVQAIQQQMQLLQEKMAVEQQQLQSLQTQLQDLKSALSVAAPSEVGKGSAPEGRSPLEDQQAAMASQIGTLDEKKVETESRFPVRVHGTLLLNGFINSASVDDPAAPAVALGGPGSTGFTLRQTSLGLAAQGPHLLRGESGADIDVDFFSEGGSGYGNDGGVLRLRTAHASIAWQRMRVYFALDRPLLSPYRPESLVAEAVPELAWSGNLWTWNPQVGVSLLEGGARRFRLDAALIDAADPYRSGGASGGAVAPEPPSLAEASRWPGIESRIALEGGDGDRVAAFGLGAYYSAHQLQPSPSDPKYDFAAWATSLDLRLPLPFHSSLIATAYRGAGLGGLGGGGYRDYVYRTNATSLSVRALDDAGGWLGLHETVTQRVSWNLGAGTDNPFAHQLRSYPGALPGDPYGGIARNRSFYANIIYAPRAYLLFSTEYRNLHTVPVAGQVWTSNIAGFGAAYRF